MRDMKRASLRTRSKSSLSARLGGMLRLGALLSLVALLCGLAPAQDPASPDAGERRRAARDLARQGSAGIPRLTPLLSDPDLEVRIEAVKSLVDIGTQRSLDPLIQATRDNDPEIQIRASDGLVNFYVPGYVRTGLSATLRRVGGKVVSRFTDTNDQVIDPFVTPRPEVVEALGRLVRGGVSMESRANAARAVGIIRGRAAVPDLLEAVRSKDTQVIYESLIAFQKIGDRSVGPRLSFLLRDLDERVQVAAVETVGLLYTLEALPALREVLTRTGSRRVRRAALSAIAMLPDPSNRQVLLTYLQDRDIEMKAAAAEGLGRLREPGDVAALEKSFEEEGNNLARLSMAFALVNQGKLEITEFSPLQSLVNALNNVARTNSAQALLIELARKEEVRKALYQALPRGTRDEKIGMVRVLAASGDQATEAHLEVLTRDSSVEVASEAVRALRSLRARLR
jgi:HEAT repeat protein